MKTALVSGAAGALGTEICRGLLARGWSVLGLHHATPPPRDLTEKMRFHQADLGDENFAEQLPEEFFAVDALFHCASPRPDVAITHKRDLGDFDRHWRIGARAAAALYRKAAPQLLRRRGLVVLVLTSYTLEEAPKGLAPYLVQKHALLGLGLALRQEIQGRGVRVVCASPRAMDTPFLGDLPAAARAALAASVTLTAARAAEAILATAFATADPPDNLLI